MRTAAGWTQTVPDVVDQDPLNVWVDDQPVRWRSRPGGRVLLGVPLHDPVHSGQERADPVSVFDLDHRDNEGDLEVTVLREPR